MEQVKRIVLSGAPGTGKTTILNLLKQRQYACMDEVSREIIAHEQANETDVLPWKNLEAFSKLILKKRIEQFNTGNAPITFYDRAIPDVLAYLHYANKPIKPIYTEAVERHKYYSKVFITPPWEDIYTKDNERHENYTDTLLIHTALVNTYKEFGYEIVLIPKDSAQNRVNFILNTLHL